MNKYLALILILLSTSLHAASNWGKKLSGFSPEAFVIPKETIKPLPLDEAKKKLMASLDSHFIKLNDDYKTKLKLDYSPFGARWQVGRFEMEVNQLTSMDQLMSEMLEKKINEIIKTDYKDFISSEFVLSNHKVFDHENEIYELKKQLIFLNQQIELLRAVEPKEEAVAVPQQSTPYLWILMTLVLSAAISVLVKRLKFI